ncbi:MAG: cobalt chelatase [Gammaproteobacteria bacterium]|nr:cobalt chelatase [Gammaproteobacteria bacterium]
MKGESEQQIARRQQQMEELCGAAVRALTGDAELHVRARGLYRGRKHLPMFAPHLRTDAAHDGFADRRGIADAMALRMLHSDTTLHRSITPEHPVQRVIFELLEQLRVESLVPASRPGMSRNLRYRFSSWSLAFHHAGLTDSAFGILLYTVSQVCWARLNACQVLEETEDLIEATRAGIVPLIGRELAALKRDRDDQAAFAVAALSIASTISGLMDAAQLGEAAATEDDAEDADATSVFRFLLDFEDGDDGGIATVATGRSKVFDDAATGYRVFSTQYDRVVEASSLVRPVLLRDLRERLDRRVQAQAVNVPRLTRQLAALLAAPDRDGWVFGEEEGYVDGARLAQLVGSPAERRVFRQIRIRPVPQALFTILIDCSGSMKAYIEAIAALVDVFVRALDSAGVDTEVLGFTTGGWNGGRVQQDWLAQRRPAHPGRLNELLHLVYKGADTSWRRARHAIAAMLKPDLFREGIDGEAVDWACARMLARDASRRMLLVISDGCPMDTATKLANDAFYLDNHLKNVVARREREGGVEIFGLGVGLDLSPYYNHCLAIDLSQDLDNRTFDDILQLLQGRHHR